MEKDGFYKRDREKEANVNSLQVLSSKLHFKINSLLDILTQNENSKNSKNGKNKTLQLQKSHLAELSTKLIDYFKDRRFNNRIKSRLDLGATI